MENLDKTLKLMIDKELENCNEVLYPNICRLQNSKIGRDNIYNLVRGIIAVNPMDIRSALAQVESGM